MSTDNSVVEGTPDPERSGVPHIAYLVFLIFVVIVPAMDPGATTGDWVLAGVIVVVSGALFVAAGRVPRWRLPVAVALMAIGVAGTALGTGAMGVLPTYAAGLAATSGSRRQVLRRLWGITGITVATAFLSPVPMPFLLFLFVPPLVLVWVVGLSVLDDVSRARQTDQLRAENARIEYLATVTERERIARDLHDLAGQALTAVTLRSQLVQRLAGTDHDRVVAEASAIEATARQTLESLRATVAGWQQVRLDEELVEACEALSAAGVEPVTSGDWDPGLAPSVETVLALALREAVTNVVRHAAATRCSMRLSNGAGEVVLEVSDDGSGSDSEEGTGLRGMRERVMAAGGSVDRSQRRGATVRIAIPVGGRS